MTIDLTTILISLLFGAGGYVLRHIQQPSTPNGAAPTLGHGLVLKLLADAIASAEPALKPALTNVLQAFIANLLAGVHLPPAQVPAPK